MSVILRGSGFPDDTTKLMTNYRSYINTMNTVIHSLDNEKKARSWMSSNESSEVNSISFTMNAPGVYTYNNNEAAKMEQRAILYKKLMCELKRDREVRVKSSWMSIIELHETPTMSLTQHHARVYFKV